MDPGLTMMLDRVELAMDDGDVDLAVEKTASFLIELISEHRDPAQAAARVLGRLKEAFQ